MEYEHGNECKNAPPYLLYSIVCKHKNIAGKISTYGEKTSF
jgi:hypothetical protein